MKDRKRFLSLMFLVFAAAALVWALLRVYNVAQDHERNGRAAPRAGQGS